MNKLAQVAIEAVNNPKARSNGETYPLGKGLCQKFFRLVFAAAYPEAAEKFRAPSAKAAAEIWLKSGHGFRPPAGFKPQPGDVLYKTTGSGGFGHVGIYVGNNKVAENSSTSIGRVRGALGFRTLKQYGSYDVVGRWPEKAAAVAPQKPVAAPASLKDATVIIVRNNKPVRVQRNQVQDILAAAGVNVLQVGQWGDGTPAVRVEDK